jgi:DNA polymerase III epsilon subunit family exonuclease
MFDVSASLADTPLVALDTETTGASAAMGHRVIELGLLRFERGQITGRLSQLLDPGRPLSPTITWITGITGEMLVGQPSFRDCAKDVAAMLEGAVLLGHNISFDLSFLSREFRRVELDPAAILGGRPILDTLRWARRRFGHGGNSLPLLAQRLGVDVTTSHRAFADAQTTLQVFEQLIAVVGGWSLTLQQACDAQGGSVALPSRSGESPLPLQLQEALDLGAAVVMEYVDAAGCLSHRTVEPRYIRRRGGELCLVAFCRLRRAERHFRVDRIVRFSRELTAAADVVLPSPAAAHTAL